MREFYATRGNDDATKLKKDIVLSINHPYTQTLYRPVQGMSVDRSSVVAHIIPIHVPSDTVIENFNQIREL